MAKVITPAIIDHRRSIQGNPWSWVTKINKELNVNRIEADDSIIVVLPGDLDTEIYAQVKSIYEDEGWNVGETLIDGDLIVKFMR